MMTESAAGAAAFLLTTSTYVAYCPTIQLWTSGDSVCQLEPRQSSKLCWLIVLLHLCCAKSVVILHSCAMHSVQEMLV